MRRRRYMAVISIIAAALVVTTYAVANGAIINSANVGHKASACKRVTSDFNGDGRRDVVTVSETKIDIWYGSAHGFSTSPNFVADYADLGLAPVDSAFLGGPFGTYHRGFFNGDCYADLAITLQSTTADGEGIIALYGGPRGLSASFHNTVAAPQFESKPLPNTGFGQLAVGDFNRDGIDDVAIGDAMGPAWGDEEGVPLGAGGVAVLFGSSHGLTTGAQEWFTQGSPGIAGAANKGNSFGYALAAGDFNGDGKPDLAIGGAYDTGSNLNGPQAVTVMVGTGHGLTGVGSHTLTDSAGGMPHVTGQSALRLRAEGNFNGDKYADLLIGAVYSTPAAANKAGRTEFVLYGSGHGITTTGATTIRSTTAGMPHGTGKNFDLTLQTGDFNGDGVTDVAFGEDFLKVGSLSQAGGVVVLYGSHTGLRTAGSALLTAPGAAEVEGASFGRSLNVLPSITGAAADLLVGSGVSAQFLLTGGPHGLASTRSVQLDPTPDDPA